MGEEVDWDLNAVVRRFTANAAATARISSSAAAVKVKSEDTQLPCLAAFTFKEDGSQNSGDVDFADLMKPRSNGFEELQQLYRPFLISTTNNNRIHQHHTNSSYGHGQRQNQPCTVNPSPRVLPSAAVFGGFRPPELQIQPRQPQLQLHRQQQQQPPVQSQTPRSRKRKNQQKKSVCHVTAENLSSDLWAWRKYGQKPIKGSPFPRNYYRCSSSKGCGARKQVERSNSDPNMFIVTYTGDHTHPRPTHRNSLAGSTRNKLTSTLQKPADNLGNTSGNNNGDKTISEDVKPAQPSISSLSPTTPLTAPLMSEEPVLSTDDKEVSDDIDDAADCDDMDEDDELDGDDLLIPNLGNMTDDFFVMGFHHELNNNAPNSSAHNFSSAQR